MGTHLLDEGVVESFETQQRVLQERRDGVGRVVYIGISEHEQSAVQGDSTSLRVASVTITQVDSVPTSALATLNPASGSS